jgi:phenylpropionate dioxygenase-like ring-hydroxylating dioxygenase large terminal subunit
VIHPWAKALEVAAVLSREENELITRTGPGTPMGKVLRRYWIPILLERELVDHDGEPVQVQVLGERLVAFRDTDGRIGLLEEFCPHRRVSLWLGRNEECGLRCIYHGWKFDVDGNCVDQMNEPGDSGFADKVHITHYPTLETGGIIWAFLGVGQADRLPPPPSFEFTRVPASHRHASKVIEECNWLQALEGGIDTSHAPILHRALSASSRRPGIDPRSPFVRGGPPTLEVDMTDYGYRYAGIRRLPEGGEYVRAYHYVMPFTQLRPASLFGQSITQNDAGPGHFWVPMDDHTCMVWNFMYSLDEALTDDQRREYGNGNGPDHVDQTTFRSVRNARNRWGMDRQVQKTETFSGIEGVNTQDRAVQESMGFVVDRSQEYLGPADKAIIAMRRLLLQAASTVQEGGDPPGVKSSLSHVRAVERILPDDVDWREAMLPAMYPAETSARELTTAR